MLLDARGQLGSPVTGPVLLLRLKPVMLGHQEALRLCDHVRNRARAAAGRSPWRPGRSAWRARASWYRRLPPGPGNGQASRTTHAARGPARPVPLEYSIGCVTCTVASMMDAVMAGLPGAAQDRLPAHVPGTRPASWHSAATGERCRAARAPAPERGAAPARQPGTVRAGRPGVARRAGTAYTAQALNRDLPRDARDAPGLAPQTGRSRYDTSKRRKPRLPLAVPRIARQAESHRP